MRGSRTRRRGGDGNQPGERVVRSRCGERQVPGSELVVLDHVGERGVELPSLACVRMLDRSSRDQRVGGASSTALDHERAGLDGVVDGPEVGERRHLTLPAGRR